MAKARAPFPFTLIAIDGAVAVACIVLIVIGANRMPASEGVVCLAAGLVGIVVLGATLPLALMVSAMVQRSPSREEALASATSMRQIEQMLSQMHQNSMLSDIAKRVLFRDQELNLLRRAIEDDIAHGDYNAGLTLCDDMANLFGHREEAEAYRTRILQAGHAAFEARVRQAMSHFEQVLAARDWAAAHREAASIKRLYPAHHLVQELDQRILAARDQHKQELEAQFLEAAHRDHVDHAMHLLKELDRYLSREEAERLSDVAQAVVAKHRDYLSTQFKLAVNDHRWAEAAQVGDLIIAQYPNTKMADEVRSMAEMLRQRAHQAVVGAK